jgi:hypothetical protein
VKTYTVEVVSTVRQTATLTLEAVGEEEAKAVAVEAARHLLGDQLAARHEAEGDIEGRCTCQAEHDVCLLVPDDDPPN